MVQAGLGNLPNIDMKADERIFLLRQKQTMRRNTVIVVRKQRKIPNTIAIVSLSYEISDSPRWPDTSLVSWIDVLAGHRGLFKLTICGAKVGLFVVVIGTVGKLVTEEFFVDAEIVGRTLIIGRIVGAYGRINLK